MSGNRRAMTLLEVVVYCTLLSVFSAMLFLTLPVRNVGSYMMLQEASNEGTAALRMLNREIANSSRASLSINENKKELSFLSGVPDQGGPYRYDSQGRVEWTGWLTYARSNRSLVRTWKPFSKPASVANIIPLNQMGSAPSEVVVRDLLSMKVWEEPAGCCNLRLSLSVEGSSIEVATAVVVRNP